MSPKGGFDLSDYVDVDERLRWFFEKYPEGSLEAEVLLWPSSDGLPILTVKASAYRSPDDTKPGTGLASEVYPGTTPYTKGSELMNAETSAWGRALAAIGAPTKGHIASANEVAGAAARRTTPVPAKAERKVGAEAPRETASQNATPGEAESPAPTLPADHKHTFVDSPTLKKFVVCSDPACRKVVKREEADAS